MKLNKKQLATDVYTGLKDISLRDLSKKIKISPATISRIRHEGTPDLLTYAKICKWLGVDMNKYIK